MEIKLEVEQASFTEGNLGAGKKGRAGQTPFLLCHRESQQKKNGGIKRDLEKKGGGLTGKRETSQRVS